MRVEIPRRSGGFRRRWTRRSIWSAARCATRCSACRPGTWTRRGPLPPEAAASRCALAGLAAAPVDRALGTLLIRVDGAAVEYTPFSRGTVRRGRRAPAASRAPWRDARAGRGAAGFHRQRALRRLRGRPGGRPARRPCRPARGCAAPGRPGDDALGRAARAAPGPHRGRARLLHRGGDVRRGGRACGRACRHRAAAAAGGAVRILLCDARYPRPGSAGAQHVAAALGRLAALGAWAHLLPELAGHPQAARAFAACAAAPPELALRLAALLHLLPEDGVKRRLAALCLPRAAAEGAAALVARQGVIHQAADEAALRRRFARWGRDGTARQLALCGALASAGGGAAAAEACARARALFERMCGDGTPFLARRAARGRRAAHARARHRPGSARGGAAGRAVGPLRAPPGGQRAGAAARPRAAAARAMAAALRPQRLAAKPRRPIGAARRRISCPRRALVRARLPAAASVAASSESACGPPMRPRRPCRTVSAG